MALNQEPVPLIHHIISWKSPLGRNPLQIYEKFSISNTFYSYFNKKSSELFVDSRKSTIFAPTNPARFP